jgi:hypothetical protein
MFTSAKRPGEGVMRSVTVQIRAAEFSATMSEIGEWLDANRHKPTRYKYDHTDDAVLVTVDFPAEVAATAFATRFDSVYYPSLHPASADPPRLPTQADHPS